MGQRANLAIGNASGYELFYSHWCANSLPRDLFWGPQHAIDFITEQRSVEAENGWLDTIWAEGGAVVDPRNRSFLFYGGEDLLYDVPLRRLFLKMIRTAWEGWTIKWAYEGIVDIAEYVGVDREHVIADSKNEDEYAIDLKPPPERDWLSCVASTRSGNAVSIYPLNGLLIDYLLAGPRLLDASKKIESLELMNVSDWTSEFPVGGFHVDNDIRQLNFWMADDGPNALLEIQNAWHDWDVVWHKDNFESQVELTNSALSFNQRSQSDLLTSLLDLLDRDSKPVDIFGLAKIISEHENGGKVEINPMAIRDDRLPVDEKRRQEILAACVAALDDG